MKLCKHCIHSMVSEFSGGKKVAHCALKSPKINLDPYSGNFNYTRFTVASCVDERKDSNGFFGLFKDKTRCGVEAKNFVPKPKPIPPSGE